MAGQKHYSGVELSKVSPKPMAHDAVNRWLSCRKLTPKLVWQNTEKLVDKHKGYLVLDDTVLDKFYSQKIDPVHKVYSGKHHKVVKGIDVVNMVWSDGDKIIPVDYRVYDPTNDGKTRNYHAREMMNIASKRGFKPVYVLFDSWFCSIKNIKTCDNYDWKWISELKNNRKVSLVKGEYIHVSDLGWTKKQVYKVWLKEYGFVLVTKTVTLKGDVAYLATNDLSLENDQKTIRNHYLHRWTVETFHRGIKQYCGIEKCYSRCQRAQRNHILSSFLAFIKLETNRIINNVSWHEAKLSIVRPDISNYLASTA